MNKPRSEIKMCDCGRVAAKKKHGEWVCQRCDKIECVQHRADSDNKPTRQILNLNPDIYAKT